MSETNNPEERPPLPDDAVVYLVNRMTDAGTRLKRTQLTRDKRGMRTLRFQGAVLRPDRNYPYKVGFLRQHRDTLLPMEQSGMVGFRNLDLTWNTLEKNFPAPVERRLVIKEPPLPPPGDMPAEHMQPPPEGGFQRAAPAPWVSNTSPQVLDSINKVLAAGNIRRPPDPEGFLKRRDNQVEVSRQEDPPAEMLPGQEAPAALAAPDGLDQGEEGTGRPNIPPPTFQKRTPLPQTDLYDPFAEQ